MRPEPGGSSPASTAGLARLIDAAVGSRVLVHGSPPGAGRDLDLLVRPAEERRISAALLAAGFAASGHAYVRFAERTVFQAELIPAASWDLPAAELEAVFAEGRPIEGYDHLVRPSPAHTLLILARRIVEGPGVLDAKRRGYIDWAVGQDPRAWERAEARAGLWRAERPLDLLQRLGGHAFVPRTVRAAVIEERLRRSGRRPADARLEALRQVVPKRHPVAVVAISGLDGSGKSTQARLLVDSLERIGIPAAVEWAKVGEDRRLWAVRRTGQRVLRLVRGRGGRDQPAGERPEGEQPAAGAEGADGGVRFYESGSVLRFGWPLVAALSNVLTFRLQAARYDGRARILVYDRYVLDTAVHLRWRYRLSGRQLGLVETIVAWSAPRPLRAYFLRLDPATAWARKREDAEHTLREHAALYDRRLNGPAGRDVVVLDGDRPVEELAATIGMDVWAALSGAPGRHRRLRRLGAAVQARARRP